MRQRVPARRIPRVSACWSRLDSIPLVRVAIWSHTRRPLRGPLWDARIKVCLVWSLLCSAAVAIFHEISRPTCLLLAPFADLATLNELQDQVWPAVCGASVPRVDILRTCPALAGC